MPSVIRRSGLIIAAPHSGAGKTTVTLAALRALRNAGVKVCPFKVGPDYIDPAFLSQAAGVPAYNLDPWAMPRTDIQRLIAQTPEDALCLVEGVMGLFDGPGSTAELARLTGWPILLLLDASRTAQTLGALAWGLTRWDPSIQVAACIVNRIGSPRHAASVQQGLSGTGLLLLALLPRAEGLALPSRHLGLVQAEELANLEAFLQLAAQWLGGALKLDALLDCAAPGVPLEPADASAGSSSGDGVAGLSFPPGAVAVAQDAAFRFAYRHWLGWERVLPFSPLADEAPDPRADFIFLPGGYPELHAAKLAGAQRFKAGMTDAAARSVPIYGECGGYMVLGEALQDAAGQQHEMLGLLPLATSFVAPQRRLGYRRIEAMADLPPWFARGQRFRGHQFHYARTLALDSSTAPLFDAGDAEGQTLGLQGLVRGTVAGSFLHLIATA